MDIWFAKAGVRAPALFIGRPKVELVRSGGFFAAEIFVQLGDEKAVDAAELAVADFPLGDPVSELALGDRGVIENHTRVLDGARHGVDSDGLLDSGTSVLVSGGQLAAIYGGLGKRHLHQLTSRGDVMAPSI